MKKVLFWGLGALVLAGCSKNMDFTPPADYTKTQKDATVAQYESAFVQTFGVPGDNQDWGFGSSSNGARAFTRANAGDDYPATSGHINANGNEWAASTTGNNPKTFGGWVVPDPLTEAQMAVVKAYFQANPNLTYQDPEWRHFFVQQVYKGATAAGSNSTEIVTAANGTSKYTGANMGELYVGPNKDESFKVNGFTSGDASVYQNVLNNGEDVNTGTHHSDKIMLMVNIDDTSKFTYTNSGSSSAHNDKSALVGWETIRTWANSHGYNGECLNDGWNRSFLGFDLELYSLEEAYAKNGNNKIFAQFSAGQNDGLKYVWNGTQVLTRGTAPTEAPGSETDLTAEFLKYGYNITNKGNGAIEFNAWGGIQAYMGGVDWSTYEKLVLRFSEPCPFDATLTVANQQQAITTGDTEVVFNLTGKNLTNVNEITLQSKAAGTLKIASVTLYGNPPVVHYYESDYLLVNGKQVPFLSANTNMYGGIKQTITDNDMKTTQNGKECFDMTKIAELVNAGYLPVKDTNLRDWVKWQGGDGYYSDWIVTLSKAYRIGEKPIIDDAPNYVKRVMAEDLSATEGSDFDFNDVVFDVAWTSTGAKIKLQAAGGTLPLYIGDTAPGHEVHAIFAAANPTLGITTADMINTRAQNGDPRMSFHKAFNDLAPVEFDLTGNFFDDELGENNANKIKIYVVKDGKTLELTAVKAAPASKFGCPITTDWADEFQNIDDKWPVKKFTLWVQGGANFWE